LQNFTAAAAADELLLLDNIIMRLVLLQKQLDSRAGLMVEIELAMVGSSLSL